jgi:hypothetical protein
MRVRFSTVARARAVRTCTTHKHTDKAIGHQCYTYSNELLYV